MHEKTIVLIKDFDPRPYGRGPEGEESSGQKFRDEVLAPALREYEHVHVDLSGYNRYGRSFLDEAFGGLIRESGFSGEDIHEKLSYSHDLLQSLIAVIDQRIEAAIEDSYDAPKFPIP
ncbi:DUF4325 domain-containing protein [Methylophaga sp. 42_25_T18]|nr:DUF4325 domain-containing protein [Methylophaga sp. 42_25_T18]